MSTVICNWVNTIRIARIPRQAVRKVQTTHFARKVLGCTSLGVALVKCEGIADTEGLKNEKLTHEQCIKQACLLSVNSASTLLTTTSAALLDICKEYRDSLNKILSLMEEVQTTEGGENPVLWDEIVAARVNVNRAKAALTELNSYMESVEKVVNSTTEAAFLAGAEYMCTALCERLYSAQREINSQIVGLKKLEEDYVKLQQEIARTKEKENKPKVKNSGLIRVRKDDQQVLHP